MVWAFVALRPETEASAAALKVWAGERIAAYKDPERIVFMAALPKGVTGKVDRKGLRERAVAEREPVKA